MNQKSLLPIMIVLSGIILSPGCGAQKKDGTPSKQVPETFSRQPDPAPVESVPASTVEGRGAAAIERATRENKFLLMLFYQQWDDAERAMMDSIAASTPLLPQQADTVTVNVTNPTERVVIEKYGAQRARLPLLLVIAPNGVVTGGYPQQVTGEQLKQGFSVSELMLEVLKPLQEQKVALVALQNQSTKLNTDSWQGVNDFANDANYKQFVTAIKADPSAAGSQEFLKQCRLLAPLTQATVVVLLPPGKIGKVLTGKTTKADILKSLQSCSPGGGGCCSDRRFKRNITPIDSALEKLAKLHGVTFAWDRAGYPQRFFPEGARVGLIAQDVEKVFPEVVDTDSKGYKSIHYDNLTAVLIEAVKQLNDRIASQDSLIRAQNARIKALEVTYQ